MGIMYMTGSDLWICDLKMTQCLCHNQAIMHGFTTFETPPWVKVFRIIPEFRILRLTFHESQPQNPEFLISYTFSITGLESKPF